jgi:glycine hydroxymethyltransferase
MGKPEMNQIATFIARAIKDGEDDSKAKAIRAEVHQLTAKYSVYPEPKN